MEGSTCNLSIVFGTILIALLITMIVMNHRKQYEQFYMPASVNDSYMIRPRYTTDSLMTNIIFSSIVIIIILIIMIMVITAKND